MGTLMVQSTGNTSILEYILWSVIALLILVYLIYSLIKPEKF